MNMRIIVIFDVTRLEEIDLMKKQYEHWLTEKDKALSGSSLMTYIQELTRSNSFKL